MMKLSIAASGGRLEFSKKKLRSVLRGAGGEIRANAKQMLGETSGGGRSYWGFAKSPYRAALKHRYRASAPGQPPVKVDGELEKSIVVKVYRSGEAVAIRSTRFYALFLEAGAKGGGGSRKNGNLLLAGEVGRRGRVLRSVNRLKTAATRTGRILEPRPFLSRALDEAEASISARIGAAINEGVSFKREKLKRRRYHGNDD